MRQKHSLSWIFAVLAIAGILLLAISQNHENKNRLFIIVIDGFASSYLNATYFLKSLAENPSSNSTALAVFPYITPSSHVSILTGVPPKEHGIVDYNSTGLEITTFFEKLPKNIKNCAFYAKNSLHPFLSLAEQTFIPRNNASVKDIDLLLLDTALVWVKDDKCNISFISLPFTDTLGHHYGPNSGQIKSYAKILDWQIKSFVQQLRGATIIITADHGMCEVNGTGKHAFMQDKCAEQIPIMVYNSDNPAMGTIMEIYNFTLNFYTQNR